MRTNAGNSDSVNEAEWTTLMLRNLPNDYKGDMLLKLLNSKEEVKGLYNFVYLPMDFKRKSGLGYAFVNMVTHEAAEKAKRILDGHKEWEINSSKVLKVDWGADQGLQTHLDRYKNSPVMHDNVEESYKPMYFENGELAEFPAPTKRIRAPRAKARAKERE